MSTRNLTAVEGLRFFLFLGIFVFHSVSCWFPIGWGGVEAFLVIGAYFLTCKYLKCEQHDVAVGKAFVGRIKRLYPAYVILIVVAVALVAISSHQVKCDALWYLFSLQNYRCLFDGDWNSLESYLGHFWYIGLDVWLFLLWVVLMRLIPKKHLKKAYVVTLCTGLLWRTLFVILRPDNPSLSYVIPVGLLDCWSVGGLVAINFNEKGKNNYLEWTEIIVGAIGVLALIGYNAVLNHCSIGEAYQLYHTAKGYMLNPITGNIHLFIALLAAGVLRYCLDTTKKHPVLSWTPLAALGGMTYEIYCFHLPILTFTRHFIHNSLLILIVALLVTYVVSLLWCRLAMPVINKIIK